MVMSKSSACVLFLLVVSTASLQHGIDIVKEQWSPYDIFRADPQPEGTAAVSTAAAAALHGERLGAKRAVKSASKQKHVSKGKVTYWELEDDSFEQPNQFCEESCTSSNLRVTTWESKCETTNCQGCEPCKEFQMDNVSKHLWEIQPLGDRVPPRMLVASGCDGSSAVLKHAHAILKMHGIKFPVGGEQRPYDKALNEEFAANRTMVQMHEELKSKNQTLLFRGTISSDMETILSKDLFDVGALVVQVSRRNLLDQLTCMVKDCFGSHMGHPVLRGEESDLCIKRRQAKGSWMKGQYKAFVDVNTLLTNMKNLEGNMNKTATDLHNLGYTPAILKTEDLLDFQWNKDRIGTAEASWKHLLNSWGIEPDQHALMAYLRENVGTREPSLSHHETIFNFDSVKEEITNGTKYEWMLRE